MIFHDYNITKKLGRKILKVYVMLGTLKCIGKDYITEIYFIVKKI